VPIKVLPTKDDFLKFKHKIEELGFRQKSTVEFKKDFSRLGLEAPRKRKGREVGFLYFANGLKVIVWTTFLKYEREARDKDEGWILIVEGDTALYFSHPIRRTEDFLMRLLRHAWIAKRRVEQRPLCPQCKKFMMIVRGKGLGSRYWRCTNRKAHGTRGYIHASWDIEMPKKAAKFIARERKNRKRYRNKRTKEGKTWGQARFIRKPWKKTRPENQL